MSLYERFDLEEGKIEVSDFLVKNCFSCKYWVNLITHKIEYCHKCINNPKISIKSSLGYSIETLYDYYTPDFSISQPSQQPLYEKRCIPRKL